MSVLLDEKELVQLNKILTELYEEDNYEKVFSKFLEKLKCFIAFDKGDIYFFKNEDSKIIFEDFIMFNWGDKDLERYLCQYCFIDDALPFVSSKQPTMFRSSDMFQLEERRKTKYYNELLGPAGMDYSIEGNLYIGDNSYVGGIGLHRSHKYGDFSKKELEIMKLFRPHLTIVAKKFQDSRNERNDNLLQLSMLTNVMDLGICVWDYNMNLIEHNLDHVQLPYAHHMQEIMKELFVLGKTLRKSITESGYCIGLGEHAARSRITVGNVSYYVELSYMGDDPTNLSKGKFVGTVYDYATIFSKLIEEFKKEYSLTNREYEILHSTLSGLSNIEISQKLFISVPTVKKHLTSIYMKMGIEGKHQIFGAFF